MGGYLGKVLRVSLDRREAREMPISQELARDYIGGSGLAARILWKETAPDTDPLAPENALVFMTGPLTGTQAPSSGRHALAAKAPLTGVFGEGDVGGYFGTALKRAGFDGVVVRGRADAPVYLWIHDGDVEIRDARNVWGLDTYETDAALRAETDADAVVSCIGPAGERLIPLAVIVHDGKDARTGGRGGLGAVMGSKNLKAIVAKGSGDIPVADPAALRESVRRVARSLAKNNESSTLHGTAGYVEFAESIGDLPVRNWSRRHWPEGAKAVGGVSITQRALGKRFHCGACFVSCGRTLKDMPTPFGPLTGAGPEYESVACLGSNCQVDDLEAVLKANELCNRYGIDTISAGSAIAFAMDASERGLISRQQRGYELSWGNPIALIEMVREIGTGQGLGTLLGRGVRHAAASLGCGAEEFAVHCKGLEYPGHDPRAFNSCALGYATSNRGACHLQAMSHTYESGISDPMFGIEDGARFREGPGRFVARTQDLMCLFDSLKVCKFMVFGGANSGHLLEWLNTVTGFDMEPNEFVKAGERIFNLKRLYNIRCGVRRQDDTIPALMLTSWSDHGEDASIKGFDAMLDDYYAVRGWNTQGIPGAEKLSELHIEGGL